MTETAYMTERAWETCSPSIVKGIRAMAYIKENPQWWAVEICGGFGPHLSNLNAMQIRYDNKILAVKEEGEASHVNQAYDKFVAKEDKTLKRECLAILRNAKDMNGGVIDQWGLVHTVLYMLRVHKSSTWTRSFHAVNLDPRTRVSFADWCKKLNPFCKQASLSKSKPNKINTSCFLRGGTE